jgi:hypothetical protein
LPSWPSRSPAPEIEDAGDGPGDHELLVGSDDPHRGAGARREISGHSRIAPRVELDAEEAESVADPLPDDGRVLADAAREDDVSTPPSAAAKEPIHFLTW